MDADLFTQARSVDRNYSLVKQILRYPLLRPTFEIAFFPELGAEYLRGGPSIISNTHIGASVRRNDPGVNFFVSKVVKVRSFK